VSTRSKTKAKPSNGTPARPAAPAWPAPTIASNVRIIPLSQIEPDPDQPRKEFDADDLAGLAGSLAELGQLQPLRVRRRKESDHIYLIVEGERRWRAAHQASLRTLQCVIVEGHDDPGEVLLEQLAANEARQELMPLEQAAGYLRAQELTGLSQSELARKVGVKQSTISKRLALLRLPAEVQDLVASGDLDAATAYELRTLDAPDAVDLAALACAEGWTRDRTIQEVARQLNPPPPPPVPSAPDTDAGTAAMPAAGAPPEPSAGPGIGQAGAPGKFEAGAIRIVPVPPPTSPGELPPGPGPGRVLIYDRPLAAKPHALESLCDRIDVEDAALRHRGAHVRSALLELDDHHVIIVTGRDPECPTLVTIASNGEGHPSIVEALELALAEARRHWGPADFWPVGTRVRVRLGVGAHDRPGVIVKPRGSAGGTVWVRIDEEGADRLGVPYGVSDVVRDEEG
jgi:ParB family chromosome partitioning protein